MIKKSLYCILMLLITASFIHASETVDGHAGEYGFQMLKLCTNPEFSAQAQTGALYSLNAGAFFIHPSAMLNNKGKNIEFATTSFYAEDIQLNSLAWRKSGLNRSFGLGVRYLDYGRIENRSENGHLIGEYNPIDLQIVFNYGQRIFSSHLLGININGIYEDIHTASASGISADLGYIYETPFKGIRVLSAVKNIGKTNQMESESIKLPLTYELGASAEHHFSDDIKLNGEIKSLYHIDDDNLKLYTGANLELYNLIYLRGGMKVNHDTENISAGMGIKVNSVMLNYAYIPSSNDLDDTHNISVSWSY